MYVRGCDVYYGWVEDLRSIPCFHITLSGHRLGLLFSSSAWVLEWEGIGNRADMEIIKYEVLLVVSH